MSKGCRREWFVGIVLIQLIEYNVENERSAVSENALAKTLSLKTQEYTEVVQDIKVCILSYLCWDRGNSLFQSWLIPCYHYS